MNLLEVNFKIRYFKQVYKFSEFRFDSTNFMLKYLSLTAPQSKSKLLPNLPGESFGNPNRGYVE